MNKVTENIINWCFTDLAYVNGCIDTMIIEAKATQYVDVKNLMHVQKQLQVMSEPLLNMKQDLKFNCNDE